MTSLSGLFTQYSSVILATHIFFMVIGMGGALISDLLFFRFLGDRTISRKEMEVLSVLKNTVMVALGFILLSGVFLVLPDPNRYLHSSSFLLKMSAVGVLTINGIALHVFVAPYLLRMNFKKKSAHETWRHIAFALGGVSVTSWLTAFFTAMLKNHISLSFIPLLMFYFLALICAIISTQLVEKKLKARRG